MTVDYFIIPEITVSYKDQVKASERFVIQSSQDASKIFAEALSKSMQYREEIYALFLNRANRVLGIQCVGVGGLSEVTADIRIILQTALKASACGILLAHNHPSGSTIPSQQDIQLTKNLKAGCKAVGLQLLDHLIITDENYTSLADQGLI